MLKQHHASADDAVFECNAIRLDEDEKKPGHWLFSPAILMSKDAFDSTLRQISFRQVEIKAAGSQSEDDSDSNSFSHSHEEEFILWMLTHWMDSLHSSEQTSVSYILRSLESREFYGDLTSADPEVGFILDAWDYIHQPLVRTRITADPDLSNYVPYAELRVQEVMDRWIHDDTLLSDPIIPEVNPFLWFLRLMHRNCVAAQRLVSI